MNIKNWTELDFTKNDMVFVTVTPELAKKALQRNYKDNRNISSHTVERYRSDMENGKWRNLAQNPLRFSSDGELLDGQHRLSAQLATGETFEYWVQTGLCVEDFKAMDNGKIRSVSDFIKEPNATRLASMTKIALLIDSGFAFVTVLNVSRTSLGITRSEILEYYEENKDMMVASLNAASRMYLATQFVSFPVLCAFVYTQLKLGSRDLDGFIDAYCGNETKGAVMLREYALKLKARGEKPEKVKLLGNMFSIYDDYVSGRDTKSLNRYAMKVAQRSKALGISGGE